MDNLGYLFGVFGIVWIVVFIYIFSLIDRQKRLQKEIDSLKEMLEKKGLS